MKGTIYKLRNLILGLSAILVSCAHQNPTPPSQSKFDPASEAKLLTELNRFMEANRDGGLVLIVNPVIGSTNGQSRIGTGFILAGPNSLYIATANHVVTNCSEGTAIYMRGPSDSAFRCSLRELQHALPPGPIAYLGNSTADCAIIPISVGHVMRQELAANFKYCTTTLVVDLLGAPTNELRGREVIARGFASGIFSQNNFKPPMVRARVASELLHIANGGVSGSYFLLDAPSIQGLSGGPVSLLPEIEVTRTGENSAKATAKSQIIGVITHTISDDTGGKLARVCHISGVVELVDKFESGITRVFQMPRTPLTAEPTKPATQ